MSNWSESNAHLLEPSQFATLGSLHNKTISTPLCQNIRTDEAVDKVLDAACWPKEKGRFNNAAFAFLSGLLMRQMLLMCSVRYAEPKARRRVSRRM